MIEIPQSLINLMRSAKRVAVLTGAGVSAESGVPTFRQAQTGLWAQYDPQSLATPEAFRADPELVWNWYAWRRELAGRVSPNPGHYALAQIEACVEQFDLFTQNVDDLHDQAGSQNITRFHGNIFLIKCFDQHHMVEDWQNLPGTPPKCPICGSYLRPDVVWFGEMLPPNAIDHAVETVRQADVVFSIGTSSLVMPAAAVPVEAINASIPVIEINPNPTPISDYVAMALRGKSGEILPALVDAVWPDR
ncbi:MAG: NAD-dependent deacylase [Chloroflexota bacterium]